MQDAGRSTTRRSRWTDEQVRALADHVERELAAWLPSAAIPWRRGDAAIERAAEPSAWSWSRTGEGSWELCEATAGAVAPYYQLLASTDHEHFVLTHSNTRAGIWAPQWLVATATVVPFLLVDLPGSLPREEYPFSIERRSVSRLLAALVQQHPPNLDWPT